MDPSTMYLTAFLIIGGIIFWYCFSIMYHFSYGCLPKSQELTYHWYNYSSCVSVMYLLTSSCRV